MNAWTNDNPEYFDMPITELRGNPLVEAMAPPPTTVEESILRLSQAPEFNEAEREQPACYRALFPARLLNFMFPTQQHVRLLQRIYGQVLNGYRRPNPLSPEGQGMLHGDIPAIPKPANISFLTGLSGMGKSTVIKSIMRTMGNPVIRHSCYRGTAFTETQLLYLMRNVPDQCSAKALCKSFGKVTDALLGLPLYSKQFSDRSMTRTDYVDALRKIITNHHVGALILDEFQNISLAKSGGKEELVALIINLRDELGVPIILVGTYRAASILKDDPSTARRLVEGGFHELQRPADPSDNNWQSLCEIVFDYQWVLDPQPLTDEFVEVLYRYSQGVTGIMLNLYVTAQTFAIEEGIEKISPQLIEQVYKERFRPLHHIIDILSTNNIDLLAQYDDLYFDGVKELLADPLQSRLEAFRSVMQSKMENQVGILQPAVKKAAKPRSGRIKKHPEDVLRSLLRQGAESAGDIFSQLG